MIETAVVTIPMTKASFLKVKFGEKCLFDTDINYQLKQSER
jgi:hypothetical protein